MNLTFEVHQPVESVFDYLTDMQKFAAVHPVISKIDMLSENNYLVHETLKFRFVPFSFTYPVFVEHDFDRRKVWIKATVMKLTKIEMHFNLREEQGFTVVEETILFKSPLPIKSTMQSIFRKQHALLFGNIDKKMA